MGSGEQNLEGLEGAFPLLVTHLKLRTGKRAALSPLLLHDRKGVNGGPQEV